MKLYELVGQYRALEALESSDDLPAEVIRDTLDGLEGQLQDKATNVALFCRNLDATVEAIEDAAAQMTARAKRLRARSLSLKGYMLFNLQAAGISKVESPFFTVRVQKNPPTVIIDSENLIPARFMRKPAPPPPAKEFPDKVAIAEAIKAGEEVAGAHLEQYERLEIQS